MAELYKGVWNIFLNSLTNSTQVILILSN